MGWGQTVPTRGVSRAIWAPVVDVVIGSGGQALPHIRTALDPSCKPLLQEALQYWRLHLSPLPSQMQASPVGVHRNQAGRGSQGVYYHSVPKGQGHWTLFVFWGRGCHQRTRKTRKLTANCTWPKTGTPKLR